MKTCIDNHIKIIYYILILYFIGCMIYNSDIKFFMVMHHTWLVRYLKMKRVLYPNISLHKMHIRHLKYFILHTYAPVHPRIRDGLIACKLIRHSGRQQFLLGHLAPHISHRLFIEGLKEMGYRTQLLAWKDDSEIASLCLPNGSSHQYHLRVFVDGEVRGHYEYAPEAYLFAHLASIHFSNTREFFLHQLKNYIVPANEYEFIEEDRPFVTYARAFICFFYRHKHQQDKEE